MIDLVERLRDCFGYPASATMRREAADEIERLRATNEALEIMEATGRREATGFIAEIERLRAALRAKEGLIEEILEVAERGTPHNIMVLIENARAALKEGK